MIWGCQSEARLPAGFPDPARDREKRCPRGRLQGRKGNSNMTGELSLERLLAEAFNKRASDLHLVVPARPTLRVNGKLEPIEGLPPLTPEESERLCFSILSEKQKQQFEENREFDFSYSLGECMRFRANYCFQRGSVSAAFRIVRCEIPGFEELGLPGETLGKICRLDSGYVICTGATGSGKSTTLAAMINHVNRHLNKHIITIEDPIEYLFTNESSIIQQRALGDDTLSFASALKHCLRHDPDMILVGEMRDLETIKISLTAAITGHLVFSTLHAGQAVEAIHRVIDVFPPEQQQQVRLQLSISLSAVIAQKLLPRADGSGQVIATEMLVATPPIRHLIREGKPQEIRAHLEMGLASGMHTLNHSLARLWEAKSITRQVALAASPYPRDLEILLTARRKTGEAGAKQDGADGRGAVTLPFDDTRESR